MILLVIAVVLAAFYRSFLLHAPLFYASDELYHYSVARNAVENGFVVQKSFPLSGYPNGTLVTEPKGLYYIAVIPYFFLRSFVSLMDVMRILPLIFGVFDVILIFLIGNKLFDKRIAIIAAFILAANVANIQRTAALVYRGDGFMPLFFLISLYFLILFFEKNRPAFSFISAAFLSFGSLVWNGATFGYLTFALSLIFLQIFFFLKGDKEKLKLNFWNILALFFAFLLYTSYKIFDLIYEQPFMHNFPFVLIAMLFFFILLLFLYRSELIIKLILLFFIVLLSLIVLVKFYSTEIENIISGYGLVKPTSPLGKTIAELQPVTIPKLFENFSTFFPLMFLGLFALFVSLFLNNFKGVNVEALIIVLTFFSTSFFLAIQSLRFASLLSYSFSLFAAFGFVWFIDFNKFKIKDEVTRKISLTILILLLFSSFSLVQIYFIQIFQFSQLFSFLATFFYLSWIFGLIIFETLQNKVKEEATKNILSFIFVALTLAVYYFDSYPLLQGGNIEYNQYWDSAMKWLGENSPSNSGVIIWWNEGTMVELLAHRAAYIDSVGAQNEERITLFSKLMLSPKFNSTLFKNFKNNDAPVFLVTSPLWMWQIRNWLTMTNTSVANYGFATFAKVTPYPDNTFVFTSDDGKWNVFFNITDAWIINEFGKREFQSFVITNYTSIYEKNINSRYTVLLIYNSTSRMFEGGFLVTKQLANTTYIKLQFYCTPYNCFYPFKQIYANPEVKIFYVDPSAFS
jgi:asparagine N-glycosylation enzyme membrane subunit Stt3